MGVALEMALPPWVVRSGTFDVFWVVMPASFEACWSAALDR